MRLDKILALGFAALTIGSAQAVLAQDDRAGSMRRSGPGSASVVGVEGEALAAKATANRGKVAAQSMAAFGRGWSGDAQLLWSGGAVGSVLDLSVDTPAAGVYAIELYFTRAPDYAQVAIEIDGKSSTVDFSGFSTTISAPSPTQAGRFPLHAGPHKFRIEITGKAAQSTGYLVGLDRMRLYPVDAIGGTGGATDTAASGTPVMAQVVTPPGVAPKGKGGGQPPPQAKEPGPDCNSTCLGNVSTVYRKTESNTCKLWFRIPCVPYDCDAAAGVCRESCLTDGHCAQGGYCDTSSGLCASMSVSCKDAFSVVTANGTIQDCDPYKCVGGACKSVCEISGDCSPGYACSAGRCVKKP
jgi:hypothetical protein